MTHSDDLIVVVTTVESDKDANALAEALIGQSLAACVQIEGPITSRYRWAGDLQCSKEYRLTIKSTLQRWDDLKNKLAKIHPYDEPEIIQWRVNDVTDGYRSWVIDQTT